MSTIIGFETEIAAPPVRRRVRGLLEQNLIPIPVDGDNPTDPGQRAGGSPRARLEAGVIFCALGCSPAKAWQDSVCRDEGVNNPLDETPPSGDMGHAFGAFHISVDETSPARYDPNWIGRRLGARMEVGVSPQLAAELQTGALTGNPSLQDNATHVVAGSPTPIVEALFVLEDLAAQFEARQFYFHMDPATFSEMERVHDFEIEGDQIRTQSGHRIIADPGFDGTVGPLDPDAPHAQVNTAANGRWIYGSLPVMGWVGPERDLGDFTGGFDMGRNTSTVGRIRPALLVFDPCAVFAVQTVVPTYTADVA